MEDGFVRCFRVSFEPQKIVVNSMCMNLKFNCIALFLFFGSFLWGQDVWMHPNRGQWNDKIQYKVEMSLGELLLSDNEFIFNLSDEKQKMRGHHHGEHSHSDDDHILNRNVVRSHFPNANWSGIKVEESPSNFYRNYILGNDQSKWKSKIHSVQKTTLKEFLSGVDLIWSTRKGTPEFSFFLNANVDVSSVYWIQEGQKSMKIDVNGNLILATVFGEIEMSRPKAWNIINDRKKEVQVDFQVDGNRISFHFPEGYDKSLPLLIDPELTFSTFTGSTTDNWGMSATPDVDGNLFGGGTAMNSGAGYPISPGAFSSTYNGGTTDITITKFNENGTALIYSTFIGGSRSETPNSMIASQNGELYIYGLTGSSNFPMAGTPFNSSYSGGPNLSSESNGLGFSMGTDIFVARLSADGTNLIASTYIGGSDNDGMNTFSLNHNYGDEYRGEIILDANGNVIVTSCTQSTNFPTQSPIQAINAGGQDGVIFKMPNTLSNLTWSTYIGGSGNDAGYSVQVSSNGDIYMTGGTTSSNLLSNVGVTGGNDLSQNGGVDGYVLRLNPNTAVVSNGTYIGAGDYDQSYIVQLDIDDNVYVFGQSESDFGVSPGCYGVANSGQFIRKYTENLEAIEWTTMVGAGTGHPEISPTAFLVSDCYDIYFSGWGGQLNQINGNSPNSTTNGFPVTSDAHQSTTNGSNFYVAVLDQDASALKYATFMGGLTSSSNHVDGGTSRFDKEGRIYHSVCGSCGGNVTNGFTTTPGAYATSSAGPNCNMACFKFELSIIEATISDPEPFVCLPDPVVFDNNSTNGNAFFWNFGDGSTSTEENPTHLYSGAGDYTVTLVVTDTNGCFTPDSITFSIHIGDFNGGVVPPPGAICPGDSYQFEAFGGSNYVWSPADVLDNPNVFNPTATILETTEFTVIVSDSCGIDTVNVTLEVYEGAGEVIPDTSICIGNSVQLYANGGASYLWSPEETLDIPTSATPIATPTVTTNYYVDIITADDCIIKDTVIVEVYYTPPIPELLDEVKLCFGNSVEVIAGGAQFYSWSPDIEIDPTTGPVVNISASQDRWYYCTMTNVCGDTLDSIFVDVVIPVVEAFSDTIICPGQSANLSASGAIVYAWTPHSTLSAPNLNEVIATPTSPTMYVVTGTDQYGCSAQDSVFVDLFPQPFVQTNPNVYAFLGDEVQLNAFSLSTGVYVWSPVEYLSCVACTNPIANPDRNFTYLVTLTDINGCVDTDSVKIIYDPILYVPNTFTPDDGEFNITFGAKGGNIVEFEMLIFNRWGELIHTINDFNDSWDGTYRGNQCQDGTYAWKLRYTGIDGKEYDAVGHINLLR